MGGLDEVRFYNRALSAAEVKTLYEFEKPSGHRFATAAECVLELASMASFNPYYKWLGIPRDEQPASYYRLLGIAEPESDAGVLEMAAT